jgi:hypothetical protein
VIAEAEVEAEVAQLHVSNVRKKVICQGNVQNNHPTNQVKEEVEVEEEAHQNVSNVTKQVISQENAQMKEMVEVEIVEEIDPTTPVKEVHIRDRELMRKVTQTTHGTKTILITTGDKLMEIIRMEDGGIRLNNRNKHHHGGMTLNKND